MGLPLGRAMPRLLMSLLLSLGIASSASAVTMEWTFVGNPGNPGDPNAGCVIASGCGQVNNAYAIGTYEVTNAQYAEFLNAKAASDPFGVYSTNMSNRTGGIIRAGQDGSFSYNTIPGRENMPVTSVFATVVMERVLDLVAVLALLATYVWGFAGDATFPPRLLNPVKVSATVAAAVAATLLALMWIMATHPERIGGMAAALARVLPGKLSDRVGQLASSFSSGTRRAGFSPVSSGVASRSTRSGVWSDLGIPLKSAARSGGAAGQFPDVGGVGLAGDLDPLGHGQVRGPGVGDLSHGHFRFEDVDPGGGELAGVLGDRGQPEDPAGVGVGDDLDEAAGVAVDQGPAHVLQWKHPAVAPEARGHRIGVGHPDRTERGAGEGHPGQVGIVD